MRKVAAIMSSARKTNHFFRRSNIENISDSDRLELIEKLRRADRSNKSFGAVPAWRIPYQEIRRNTFLMVFGRSFVEMIVLLNMVRKGLSTVVCVRVLPSGESSHLSVDSYVRTSPRTAPLDIKALPSHRVVDLAVSLLASVGLDSPRASLK